VDAVKSVLDRVRRTPSLREGSRRLLTSLGVHRPGRRNDIAIFSSRRSGSTWLMELLASAPGVRFVNEPFVPQMVQMRHLPTGLESELEPAARKVVDVLPTAEARYRSYMTDPRETRVRGPYAPWSPQFHAVTNRRVFKIVHGTAIADWLMESELHLDPVFLVRHPVSTALSMQRSGVTLRALANLSSPGFRSKHLGSVLAEFSWGVLNDGSEPERRVLEWCLDNLVPYRLWSEKKSTWTLITYEELALNTRRSLEYLGEQLDVEVTQRMVDSLSTPSASTSKERRDDVAKSDVAERLVRWRSEDHGSLESRAFEIVEHFDIRIYSRDREVAVERCLHFGDTPRI